MTTNLTEMTISELITKSLNLRDEAAALEKDAKDLKASKVEVDALIIEKMGELGVERTGNDVANVTMTTKSLPTVTNWDKFYAYLHENEAYYLMQRRVSQKAVEELAADEGQVPGVEFFEKVGLSLRKR